MTRSHGETLSLAFLPREPFGGHDIECNVHHVEQTFSCFARVGRVRVYSLRRPELMHAWVVVDIGVGKGIGMPLSGARSAEKGPDEPVAIERMQGKPVDVYPRPRDHANKNRDRNCNEQWPTARQERVFLSRDR